MIDVERQDEHGRAEARFMDPGVVSEALRRAPDGTHCLAFIDPYGDTTFNQLQVPVLIEELRALRDQLPAAEAEVRARLDDLVRFVQFALNEPHTYVKFIGD